MQERIVPFIAGDGLRCNLINVHGEAAPSKGPVLLVHGAGVRANIFRPPERTTFVDYLVANGYDVWLENWRASIDLPKNPWTLDQAAVYDHPHAVQTVVKETGADEIKAVIHCQGSTSFMMSAVAGLVPQVKTIISNAVSLHPEVRAISDFKSIVAVPLVSAMTDYLDPQWGMGCKGMAPTLIDWLVRATHHECDNPVCKHASFTYGTGFPVLWRHENLSQETHEWIKHEFAAVPMTFFRQMALCLRKGHLVAVEGYKELPKNFVAQPPKTSARVAFFSGQRNLCFESKSQQRSYNFFSSFHPDYHSLHMLPDYGHLDMFIGKNAAQDVFPIMLEELERPH